MPRLPLGPRRRTRISSRPRVEPMEARLLLATITVTGTGDTIATDGIVTLHEAITAANTNTASGDAAAGDTGLDTIAFNITGAGVQTITLTTSLLPAITEPVVIDGTTQPGSSANTLAVGDNAVLNIELDGSNIPTNDSGLLITGSGGGSTIRGLVINRFAGFGAQAIELRDSNDNTIVGNFIGTNPAGTAALGNFTGVRFRGGNNRIGTPAPADRNLISGNVSFGIQLENRTDSTNTVQGNYIGVDASGNADLGNGGGIVISGVFQGVTQGALVIGGTTATPGTGAGNVISGNDIQGAIDLSNSSSDHVLGPVTIQGNMIGLGADGTTALGNGGGGIRAVTRIDSTTGAILIGGPSPAMRNIISSNISSVLGGDGILYASSSATVQGNFIGTDVTGTLDRGNAGWGISVPGDHRDPTDPAATTITIGGTTPGAGNLISGNGGGITIRNANSVIQGNRIGTQADGTSALGNGDIGIQLSSFGLPVFTTVGGTEDGAGNVIAYNAYGVDVGTSANVAAILRNSMFGNGLQGINNPAGPAPPVLTGATATSISGTLSGPAGSTFRLEFFATPGETDEGKTFLGATDVTIGGTGVESFVFTPAGGVPAGQFLTATATNPNGTSRFSAAIAIPAATTADLSVTVTDMPDPATVGGDLTYTIIVTNAGPSPATGVTLTDSLPAGVTFVSATGGVKPVGNTLTFDLGTLANATGATVTVVVRPTTVGTLTTSASISSAVVDPVAANNSAEAITTVSPEPVASADLDVTLADAPDPVAAGTNLAYTIVVGNNGPDAAQGVTLNTAVPAGTTFVSFTVPAGWTATAPAVGGSGTVSATAAGLAANTGEPATFTLVVSVAPGASGGSTINLSAQVTATTGDPTAANNSATAATTVAATPPPNTAPTAAADAYATTAGVALTVPARGVLGNDTDPENSPLGAVVVTPPSHGTLSLNADGSFRYTPAAGFSGTDRFSYRASDGSLTSAPATVTLDVAAAPSIGDTIGPRVTGLQRFGFHAQPTRLVLTFDQELMPAGATDLANFRLVTAGRDGRFGTRDDVAIALRSATYVPVSRTVSLMPRRPLSLRQQYQLAVRGGSGGLTDLSGNGLDGGDAVARFDRGALAGPSVVARARSRHVLAVPGGDARGRLVQFVRRAK